jgi:hypothetical protein
MEVEKRVPGQTIKVKLGNGMYTPDLKKHKASLNLYVQAFFRRCIVSYLFDHIFSLIHVLYFTWKVSRSGQNRGAGAFVKFVGLTISF